MQHGAAKMSAVPDWVRLDYMTRYLEERPEPSRAMMSILVTQIRRVLRAARHGARSKWHEILLRSSENHGELLVSVRANNHAFPFGEDCVAPNEFSVTHVEYQIANIEEGAGHSPTFVHLDPQ